MDTQLNYTSIIEMGKEALIQREFKHAKQLFIAAIGQDIFEPVAYNLLGVIFEYENEETLAKKMYRVALAVNPSYTPAIENLDRICQLEYTMEGIDWG